MTDVPAAAELNQPPPPDAAPRVAQSRKPRQRKSYTTASIADALERRYPSNQGGYAILYEVGNATGFNCNRHCDALVMSLWPSRGVTLSGFEFKASRSDWQKELADPSKAEAIQRYCDYWWLAVTDKGIVLENELPPTWGLMALNARGSLEVVKPAPELSPVPMDRSMLAAIFRQVAEPIGNFSSSAIQNAEYKVRRELEVKHRDELARERSELAKLTAAIRSFEVASGVDMLNVMLPDRLFRREHASPAQVGEAVRFVLNGGLKGQSSNLQHASDSLASVADSLQRLISEIGTAGQFQYPPLSPQPSLQSGTESS